LTFWLLFLFIGERFSWRQARPRGLRQRRLTREQLAPVPQEKSIGLFRPVAPLTLAQSHTWATAVLVDEFDTGQIQRSAV
jgi:hypothetical protein